MTHRFIPFDRAPEVCDTCGKLVTNHPVPSEADEQRLRSLWRTLLRLGGPYNYYHGGMESCRGCTNRGPEDWQCPTHRMRTHMATCEPKWREVEEPAVRSHHIFSGTFATSDDTTALLTGRLTCRCGEYRRTDIVTPEGMVLGQLIWHAVHEEEEQ